MTHYIIDKGRHYPRGRWWRYLTAPFRLHKDLTMVRYVMYIKHTAWHPSTTNHINKLHGIGFGWNHHNDSIRIGYKCNPKFHVFDIYAYQYDEAHPEHISLKIGEVEADTYFYVRIQGLMTDTYKFLILGQSTHTMDNPTPDKTWGVWLYPYYGGEPTAPNRMDYWIGIERKN